MTEKNVIKTDHFKTMDELIKTCNMWIEDDDHDAYYRFFEFRCMKELINTIQKQQTEIEKKDKMIDLMANNIASSDSDLCQYIDETIRCKYYAGENKKLCDDCIKQYFEKQVERK